MRPNRGRASGGAGRCTRNSASAASSWPTTMELQLPSAIRFGSSRKSFWLAPTLSALPTSFACSDRRARPAPLARADEHRAVGLALLREVRREAVAKREANFGIKDGVARRPPGRRGPSKRNEASRHGDGGLETAGESAQRCGGCCGCALPCRCSIMMRSSSGSRERLIASSSEMYLRTSKLKSDWFRVCIPNLSCPICI